MEVKWAPRTGPSPLCGLTRGQNPDTQVGDCVRTRGGDAQERGLGGTSPARTLSPGPSLWDGKKEGDEDTKVFAGQGRCDSRQPVATLWDVFQKLQCPLPSTHKMAIGVTHDLSRPSPTGRHVDTCSRGPHNCPHPSQNVASKPRANRHLRRSCNGEVALECAVRPTQWRFTLIGFNPKVSPTSRSH